MSTVKEMLERVLNFDIQQSTEMAMEERADDVLEFNKHRIYEYSEDANEHPLRSPYSPRYAKYKMKLRGKQITDLYDSGEMFKKMRLIVSNGEYAITSDADYTKYVVKWANAPVFGLAIEDRDDVWNYVLLPLVAADFKAETGAK